MSKSTVQAATAALQAAIASAKDPANSQQTQAQFQGLYDQLAASQPEAADLLQLLWKEYVASQRSAVFWQEMCQVEKHLSERISENHIQLKQNYLRLIREQ
ncbi:MAG: hypothetical protein HC886_17175 [Leptolyngbyaceae cyanobacterium SM1_1_3]|nr:hypothetical protein [Leptolyngbyaceae cyanobacterium SM1_1_3]NJN02431.1 hypothetical protein [Leptolyngbyaceae cyanobacterium RM1_1_2]NJO10477.1 hypothetical protein [Leptolyngbyaceae cyanobacterium SL_1_1]